MGNVIDYAVAANFIIKLKAGDWKKIYSVSEDDFKARLAKIVCHYYLKRKILELEQFNQDNVTAIVSGVVNSPQEILEFIGYIFSHFNFDPVFGDLEKTINLASELIIRSDTQFCDQILYTAIVWMVDVKMLSNEIPLVNGEQEQVDGPEVVDISQENNPNEVCNASDAVCIDN